MAVKYMIICRENAPLSSWDVPYTESELIDKFYDYAEMEWDELPPKETFTLPFIEDMWNVYLEKIIQEDK